MLAIMGIIVAVLTRTGLGANLSIMMIEIAGGKFLPIVFLGYVTCIVFGMAVTTVSAYILTVLLVAPSLLHFGVAPLNTHFFVFYAAILNAITPPVAAGVVAAAGLAKTKFWPTCVESVKFAFPLFLLPMLFIFVPELVTIGIKGLISTVVILVMFCALAYAFQNTLSTKVGRGLMALLGSGGLASLYLSHQFIAYLLAGVIVLVLISPRVYQAIKAV